MKTWLQTLISIAFAAFVISIVPMQAFGETELQQTGSSALYSAAIQEQAGFGRDVVEVALGDNHSAALLGDGSLWMWGGNDYGQLGDGTTTSRYYPVKVMDGVAQVALGGYYSAALKPDGSLWMWGSNGWGQLGNGTTTGSTTPVKVMDDVSRVALGGCHTAALKSDGSLWMWGQNSCGELGDGTTTHRYSPVKVMDGVAQVALGGYYSAALKPDGSLWMWGSNGWGQLGNGTTTGSTTPVKVMDDVSRVALGGCHTAALKSDGSLWMWGQNSCGELGDGTTTHRYSPVKTMEDVTQFSLGVHHSAALKHDGSLWTWGYNGYGQLGNGTTTDSTTPVKVMDDVSRVALCNCDTAALKLDGSLWTWGWNLSGSLGDGTTMDRHYPVKVMDETGGFASGKSVMDYALTDVEARCYLGFLFGTDELTDEQLHGNDFYKLMTGQLSGDAEIRAANQFLLFEDAQLSKWSRQIGGITNKSEQMVIDYLSTKTSGDLANEIAAPIINETLHSIANNGIEYVTSTYLIHGGDLEDMEYEAFWWAKIGWDKIKSLGGLVDKVKAYRENLKAVIATTFYVSGVNQGEMYNYYLAYRNSLYYEKYADGAADMVFGAYLLTNDRLAAVDAFDTWLASTPLDDYVNAWATEDRKGLLEKFARWSYDIEQRTRSAISPSPSGGDGGQVAEEPEYRIVVVNPTCEAAGSVLHVCDSNPELSYTDAIPAKGHCFASYSSDGNATCDADGTKTALCGRGCGAADTVADMGSARGHSWSASYSVDTTATCTAEGSESIHCAVCGVQKPGSSRAVARLAHVYGEWMVVKAATQGNPGVKERVCNACGTKESASVNAADKLPISACTVTGVSDKAYTGEAITQKLELRYSGKLLVEGSDYEVEYTDNVKVGMATVTIKGRGNYTGAISATFKIFMAPSQTSISKATISNLKTKTYTGQRLTQMPTVKLGGKTLKNGSDYTLSYKGNIKAGMAIIMVIGKGNYTGTLTATFEISKAKNTLTAKTKSKILKAKALAKKKAVLKNLIVVKKAKGKVTYKKVSKAKKLQRFKVNSRTGAVTVPKNTKGGTYKLKVKVIARGNANYKLGSKTVTVKIVVK